MSDADKSFERLLRSAAQVKDDDLAGPPFGFETRVVAQWRAAGENPNGLSRLLQRVALLATAVMVISTVAAVRELRQSREISDSITNEFAMADSAIQSEFSR
jgi:hypothetical protein